MQYRYQILQKPNSFPIRSVALLLFDGFSNLCLANAVEPLRAANTLARRPLYSWRHLGLTAETVRSSSGLPVQPERLGAQAGGDYLFVMPSYGYVGLDTGALRRALRAAAGRFGTLAGLDTGSWLLASAGLLDGRRATSHWDILTHLAEAFPEVAVVDDRFVIDGDRISCGGATTSLELMLALIEAHHGPALALEVAALFMYGERDPRIDPLHHMPPQRTVQAAAALMRRNVERPVDIGEIAKGLGLGRRALELAFQSHAQVTPARAYRRIRLNEARRLLEETRQGVAEIAGRCGYTDATAMTRAFGREFGLSPRALRRRLATRAQPLEDRDGPV